MPGDGEDAYRKWSAPDRIRHGPRLAVLPWYTLDHTRSHSSARTEVTAL